MEGWKREMETETEGQRSRERRGNVEKDHARQRTVFTQRLHTQETLEGKKSHYS